MDPDRELMERLKADDTGALEQLILRWRERAEAYAVSILHDPHLAEDAVMEAFARIYAARMEYEPRYAFSTYLYVIVRRICISELRRASRRPALLARETEEGQIKFSLRAKEPCRVDDIAEQFGGGGHPQASGITMDGTLEEATEQVLRAMEEKL